MLHRLYRFTLLALQLALVVKLAPPLAQALRADALPGLAPEGLPAMLQFVATGLAVAGASLALAFPGVALVRHQRAGPHRFQGLPAWAVALALAGTFLLATAALLLTAVPMLPDGIGMTAALVARSVIAGGLALAAVEHMNPVGLMGVGGGELHHTPSLSRGAILQWLHVLRRDRTGGGTTLGKRVRELIPRVEQRCLFVVISDLHDPDALPAIKRMAQDHDCAVIHLEDPAERGVLKAGFFRGVEAETGRSFTAHGRTRFVTAADGEMLARAGISYLRVPTDEPVVPRLRHFMKNRAGGARRG